MRAIAEEESEEGMDDSDGKGEGERSTSPLKTRLGGGRSSHKVVMFTDSRGERTKTQKWKQHLSTPLASQSKRAALVQDQGNEADEEQDDEHDDEEILGDDDPSSGGASSNHTGCRARAERAARAARVVLARFVRCCCTRRVAVAVLVPAVGVGTFVVLFLWVVWAMRQPPPEWLTNSGP